MCVHGQRNYLLSVQIKNNDTYLIKYRGRVEYVTSYNNVVQELT